MTTNWYGTIQGGTPGCEHEWKIFNSAHSVREAIQHFSEQHVDRRCVVCFATQCGKETSDVQPKPKIEWYL